MSNQKKSFSFNGKGYYIALVLCAVAIGISGFLYYRNASNNEDPNIDLPAINTDGTEDTQGNPTDPTQGNDDPTEGTNPTKPPKMKTTRPVAGETVMEYAMDCLAYNPTTRDWRTHNGIDIAAEAGTAVCAAAEGTVYTVYQDETMGTTVVIRHADGYITKYSSLAEDVPVSPGDTVTVGQTIGTVGQTALLEVSIGDHLHFSVTCNGEHVDPEYFLG